MRGPVTTLLLILCSLSLAACNEDDDDAGKVVATRQQKELPSWLTAKDKIEPSIWLRSREVGHEVLPSDPEVDRLRRALHQAAIRFYEDSRMIANRTDQTATMLAEAGQREREVDIMTGMVDVADASRFKKLYGQMCQQYLNLRKSGKDRTAAIAELSAAYKSGTLPKGEPTLEDGRRPPSEVKTP